MIVINKWSKSRRFGVERNLWQGCPCLHFYSIYIICGWRCTCGRLRGEAADYVGGGSSVCDAVRMKFNSRKSKIMEFGKMEGGTREFGEEILEEIEQFKFVRCGLKGNYEVIPFREDSK